MEFTARSGTLKAWLVGKFCRLIEWLAPGSVEILMECQLCGQEVHPRACENHMLFYHPEAVEAGPCGR